MGSAAYCTAETAQIRAKARLATIEVTNPASLRFKSGRHATFFDGLGTRLPLRRRTTSPCCSQVASRTPTCFRALWLTHCCRLGPLKSHSDSACMAHHLTSSADESFSESAYRTKDGFTHFG